MIGQRPDCHTDQHGAVASEYALMVALIALVVLGAVMSFGTAVLGLFTSIQPTL